MIETKLRNADLNDLVTLLREQADVKYDVIVPASKVHYRMGVLVIDDGAAVVTDDGVSSVAARLDPLTRFEDGVSERLGIPRAYLRKLRYTGQTVTTEPFGHPLALLDANVNGWLEADPTRKFLVRGFRTDDPNAVGLARALLSDKFALTMDNLDVVMAALDGARQAGVNIRVSGANLTETKMSIDFVAPEITALAPVWLGNYRSPFKSSLQRDAAIERHGWGRLPDGSPLVFAGLRVTNSETGGGAFQIMPRIIVPSCLNGNTVTKDVLRKVHVGGRLEEGVVRWSEDTQRKSLELVTAQTRDAVKSFLDPAYIAGVVADIERVSGAPVGDAVATIERVGVRFGFSSAEQASILDAFIGGGDLTAGGVMNAVTAAAQDLDDPDRASEFEDVALDVLEAVAAG